MYKKTNGEAERCREGRIVKKKKKKKNSTEHRASALVPFQVPVQLSRLPGPRRAGQAERLELHPRRRVSQGLHRRGRAEQGADERDGEADGGESSRFACRRRRWRLRLGGGTAEGRGARRGQLPTLLLLLLLLLFQLVLVRLRCLQGPRHRGPSERSGRQQVGFGQWGPSGRRKRGGGPRRRRRRSSGSSGGSGRLRCSFRGQPRGRLRPLERDRCL